MDLLAKTIAALITPQGMGAVGVVRISGPLVKEVTYRACAHGQRIIRNPRRQIYTPVLFFNGVLDYGLVTFFEGPDSYTGEDSLEVSLHGSSYIIKEFLRFIYSLGVLPASPGEFTRRAYENGKLDLLQAEAVADLIHSESEAQAKAARQQLEGRLSNVITDIGEPLRNILAEIEAYIDFPDEDISPDTEEAWRDSLSRVLAELNRYISTYSRGKLEREGIRVTLTGVPNAGKSSLMNMLLREERAIVSSVPGTTRDYLEERLVIDGVLIRLIDTAGLGDEGRVVEEPELVGMKKSRERISSSDLVLFLFDPTQGKISQLNLFSNLELSRQNTFIVVSKADLISAIEIPEFSSFKVLSISAKTGYGLNELESEIAKFNSSSEKEAILLTTERQRDAFINAEKFLQNAIKLINERSPSEYISFEIRSALNALTEIIGLSSTEDILGRIFSKFCIGK